MKRVICAVTNDLNFDQRMHRICGGLVDSGFEVTLVGRDRSSSCELNSRHFAQIRLNCWFEKGKLFYLEFNLRLFFFLLKQKVEIINAVDLDTLPACFLAAKMKGSKLVFDAHEYFEEVPEVTHRPIIKWIWSKVGKMLVPRADAAYTVNDSLVRTLSKRYNKNFSSILNVPPLKADSQSPKEVSEDRYLLYQGALNKGRGLEQLLEAMKEIDLPLKIAGEGDLSEQLRTLHKRLNLGEKVEFLGMVSPAQLRILTENAYIGLNLLSDESLSYQLSLANKFFDYMHADIPSVNMSFPEYQSINGQFEVAVLIENLDVHKISGAINSLDNNKELHTRLSANCSKACEVFNWQNEAKKLADIYTSL